MGKVRKIDNPYIENNSFGNTFLDPIITNLIGDKKNIGYGTPAGNNVYVGYNPYDEPFWDAANVNSNPYLGESNTAKVEELTEKPKTEETISNLPNATIKPLDVNTITQIPTNTTYPETAINIPLQNTSTVKKQNTSIVEKQNTSTDEKNKNYLNANRYYAMMTGANSLAVLNNYMQQPPPGIQLDLPFLNRIRMDKTPFERERAIAREQGRTSYRALREGI